MNRDLRMPAVILSPNSPRLERIFGRANLGPLDSHFGFLAKNDGNHEQIMANLVWIVIYACQRSFWAQTRRDWRELLDAQIWGPWSTILGFGPKTMEIMYKSWLILYESWSTRGRDHFEPKLAAIGENFWTPKFGALGVPFWVFAPKRWKSCTNHG